jgi:hypothetical protein
MREWRVSYSVEKNPRGGGSKYGGNPIPKLAREASLLKNIK